MEAIAKHDFNATAEDELSFRKSQVLKVCTTISKPRATEVIHNKVHSLPTNAHTTTYTHIRETCREKQQQKTQNVKCFY